MIKEAIGTGATVEQAVESAKAALAAPDSADVKTEVIDFPSKKVLGLFGGSPAKVRVYYEAADEPKEKPVKPAKKENAGSNKAAAKQKQNKVEKQVEEKAEAVDQSAAQQPEAIAYTGPLTPAGEAAQNYVKMILTGMGANDVTVNVAEDDENIILDLDCGNGYGFIIGRRGETLDSIQYLTRLVVNREKENYKRVSINAGNYRQKREDTLKELAKKQAKRVKKYGRNVVLDPMNPYERRIIHTTVQEIEGVASHSVGSEDNRKVIITLADGYKPSNPSNSRYGGSRGGYNRRGGSSRQKPAPSADKTREPRSDVSDGSFYGKIEPKAE